jgi:pyridoxine 5-phosphate synthase
MAATPEMVEIARDVKPDMVTIVPEKRKELTTEGGLDVVKFADKLKKAIEKVHEKGIKVSLFIDPVEAQIAAAHKMNADMVEIHTGAYSDAKSDRVREKEFKKVVASVIMGKKLGLGVNAGHGLHYHNVKEIAALMEIDELSIGHSIIARAVFVGLDRAIRDMLELMKVQ